jgi:hypothetical protein
MSSDDDGENTDTSLDDSPAGQGTRPVHIHLVDAPGYRLSAHRATVEQAMQAGATTGNLTRPLVVLPSLPQVDTALCMFYTYFKHILSGRTKSERNKNR